MTFRRGDKVRESADGPLMEVRAASDALAICEWREGDSLREGVFETKNLHKVVVQQAQQPQAPDLRPDGNDGDPPSE